MRRKSVEDYLEVIYRLIDEKGYARIFDISASLNVKPPSVTEMVQKLAKEGYVKYTRYQTITLTNKGREVAKNVYRRHKTLTEFLKILGVEEEIAEKDACEIEHSLHPETVERLTKFVEFVKNAPRDPKWLEHFRIYYETGKYPKCEKNEA